MRPAIVGLLLLLVPVASRPLYAGEGAGPVQPVARASVYGGPRDDEARAVAVGAAGNVFLTGSAEGEVDLGGGPTTVPGRGRGAFLASYTAGGAHRFSHVLWAPRALGLGVAADGKGRVALVGMDGGAIDLGGGPLAKSTNLDGFIGCFDEGGKHVWSRRFGGKGDDAGVAVAFDAAGDVLVAGVENRGGQATGLDVFLACHARETGERRWIAWLSGPGADGVLRGGHYLAVAPRPGGGSYLTGVFTETLTVGEATLRSKGGADFFVASFDTAGKPLWARGFGGEADDVSRAVAVDPRGGCVVCGSVRSDVDLGGGSLGGAAGNDAFVLALDGEGEHRWAHRFGGGAGSDIAGMEFPTQPDHAVGLAVQPSGDVLVAGVFGAQARWGATTLAPGGRADGFVLRVSASGEPAGASRLGVEGRLLLRAACARPGGGALLAGKLDGGGPVGRGGAALAALGEDDVLLVVLDP